ncbi:MAG: hypothetical protein IKT68_06650 [Clostridia bacterium]|nr:hypothetical protein [Clostridia bacterium]
MKKWTSVLTVLILLVCLSIPALSVSSVETVKGYLGDVNLDGKVNAADALFVLRYSVGKESLETWAKDAGDTNGDGKTDAIDALDILKASVGKECDLYRGVIKTEVPVNTAFAYWDVLEDNIFDTQQAWVCETYEDYQAFMALGYVDQDARKDSKWDNYTVPAFNESFFDTYGLVLWYRCSGWSTGGLHWSGICLKDNRIYLDIVPYSTDALGEENAIDTVYAFFYQKGSKTPETLIMRKCYTGYLYRDYGLSQFEF